MALESPRRRSQHGHKRRAILEAARRVMARDDLDGMKMRTIAREADYTPGALYGYYPSKDHLCVDLSAQALGLAARAIRAGAEEGGVDGALDQLRRHFRARPEDLDLLAGVLRSDRAEFLTGEAGRTFNGRLIAALAPIAEAIAADGTPPETANRQALNLAARELGLLLLENSGRLAALGIS